MTLSTLGEAALAHATKGRPVFPANPDTKSPMVKTGFKAATTDENQIREWWTKWPNAAIAMPTGERSGYMVLDCDPRNGGIESLTRIMPSGENIVKDVSTPSDGFHSILKNDTRFKSSVGKGPITGLDVRGEGGYVIIPPSTRSDGKGWVGRVPELEDAHTIPDWLAEPLLAAQKTPTKVETGLDGPPIEKGTRNYALFHIGCSLRGQGWEEDEIVAHLREVNKKRCAQPLDDAELTDIIGNVVQYEKGVDSDAETDRIRAQLGIPLVVEHDEEKPEPETTPTETLTAIYDRYKDYSVPWVIRPIAALGEVTLLAAPPKKGKTTFILQALRKLAMDGIPVLYYSLEMAKPTLVSRIRSLMGELDWTTDFFEKFYVVGPDELRESLWEDIIGRVQETGTQIVVVDNLLATVVGDINKTDISAKVMNTAFAAASKLNVAIVLISHTRKNPPSNSVIEIMSGPSMDDLTGNRMFTARASIVVMFSANSDGRRAIKSFSRLGEDISVTAIFDSKGFWRHSQRAEQADMEWLDSIGIDKR